MTAVRGWASVPLPPGDDVLDSPKRLGLLLRKALASRGFKGRRVVSAMPHGKVRIHSVTYRPTRERSAADEIMSLMQERLDGPLADHVLDFLPVRDGTADGERLALVAVSSPRGRPLVPRAAAAHGPRGGRARGWPRGDSPARLRDVAGRRAGERARHQRGRRAPVS